MTDTPPARVPILDFIPLDDACLKAIAADVAAFLVSFKADPAYKDLVTEVAAHTAAMLQRTGATYPWIGYLAQDPDTAELVGTCAYKGNPDAEGIVEIAYFTFEPFEGRGYATAMAQELLAQAFCHPEINGVIAHTLPERNASTRVLEKVGLEHKGDFQHPEDGWVWRWSLHR